MANEITITAVTGLSPTIQLYDGATPVGSPFSATEIASTGVYVASMPANTPYAKYVAIAMAGAERLGSGEIYWDGNYELNQSVAMLRGLDPNNPAEQTLTNLTAGNINIAVSGDPASDVTFTRVP